MTTPRKGSPWPVLARTAPIVLLVTVAAILLFDARHVNLRAIENARRDRALAARPARYRGYRRGSGHVGL